MGITGIHAIPMMIICMLQGTLCDTGLPCTFYGENICSVCTYIQKRFHSFFTLNPTISQKVNPLKTGSNFGLMSSFLKPQISWGGGLFDAEVPAVSVHKKPRTHIFAIF